MRQPRRRRKGHLWGEGDNGHPTWEGRHGLLATLPGREDQHPIQ